MSPSPMDHGCGTAGECRFRQCPRSRESSGQCSSLPTPLMPSMGPVCTSLRRKFFIPPWPAQPVPVASQRVGLGSRDQARRLPTDGPKGRQPGQALHQAGLRLVGQVSSDSRGPAIPSGPLNHRGRGGGLGWEGRQVRFREATFQCP
jgi:hypothetical protein